MTLTVCKYPFNIRRKKQIVHRCKFVRSTRTLGRGSCQLQLMTFSCFDFRAHTNVYLNVMEFNRNGWLWKKTKPCYQCECVRPEMFFVFGNLSSNFITKPKNLSTCLLLKLRLVDVYKVIKIHEVKNISVSQFVPCSVRTIKAWLPNDRCDASKKNVSSETPYCYTHPYFLWW